MERAVLASEMIVHDVESESSMLYVPAASSTGDLTHRRRRIRAAVSALGVRARPTEQAPRAARV
jgi:hypothetical protein